MLLVLAAFGLTTPANVEADSRELGKRGGALRSEGEDRAANRHHFACGLGACTHRLIAGCEHCVAMAQAQLSLAHAIAGSGNQRLVSNPGCTLRQGLLCRGSGGREKTNAAKNLSSIHEASK